MIGQRSAWASRPFRHLVEHFARFSTAQRDLLADLYDAPSAEPEALAMSLCLAPERLRALITKQLRSAQQRRFLEDLIIEHDDEVQVEWSERRLVKQLSDLGLVNPIETSQRQMPVVVRLPGAIAAMLASMLSSPARPSLMVLLGARDEDEVATLAAKYQIARGPLLAMIFELGELFQAPDFHETLLSLIQEPDWLGGALTALELGGMCYWQEVFGAEVDEEGDEPGVAKILPLMRGFERQNESGIAQLLLELGVVFRIEADGLDHPMLAIPEEMWHNLWKLGRMWLLDWVAHTFTMVEEGATRKAFASEDETLQGRLKWLCCEVDAGRVPLPFTPQIHERFELVSGMSADECIQAIAIGVELGIMEADSTHSRLQLNAELLHLLDAPRTSFARDLLKEWCLGLVGQHPDRHIPQAIGLDDAWRLRLISLFDRRPNTFQLPAWVFQDGVESVMTGMGYLRPIEESTPDLLVFELGMVNSYLGQAKLLWLDLLSMLEEGRWYSLGPLQELMQLVAAFTLFHNLSHLLDHPELSSYMPVQRASFLTDPVHVSGFDAWCRAICEELLVPLGLARVEDERVQLQTRHLRVESPDGMHDELREQLIREVFDDDTIEFKIAPNTSNAGLRAVSLAPAPSAPGALRLDLPCQTLIERVKKRIITRYDGVSIFVQGE